MAVKVVDEEQIEVITTHSEVQLPDIDVKRLVATKENVHTTVEEQLIESEHLKKKQRQKEHQRNQI